MLSGVNLSWMVGNLVLIVAVVSPALAETTRLPAFWLAWANLMPWLARLGAVLTVLLTLLLVVGWRARGWPTSVRERVLAVCLAAWLAIGLGVYWGLLP